MSPSIIRRFTTHAKSQNWFAVTVDFAIVFIGVFVGIQASNWNEARIEAQHRREIVEALVTNLEDSVAVEELFIREIGAGLRKWQEAYERGEKPAPFYFRIDGSDTAPDVWSTFEQLQLTNLFDPVTLFDLSFYYSEQNGIGRKYVRYLTVVENRILPQMLEGADGFYDGRGRLKSEYRASMDRLLDYREEIIRQSMWANCLIYRLKAKEQFAQTCRRADFRLPGMLAPDRGENRR